MTVRIRNNSRLRFGEFLASDDAEFWDMVELPEIPVQTDDLAHSVNDADRIDRLAQQYYGDASLWWVIAVANDMELLPTHFISGATIRIPSPRYVNQELFNYAPTR